MGVMDTKFALKVDRGDLDELLTEKVDLEQFSKVFPKDK